MTVSHSTAHSLMSLTTISLQKDIRDVSGLRPDRLLNLTSLPTDVSIVETGWYSPPLTSMLLRPYLADGSSLSHDLLYAYFSRAPIVSSTFSL